MENSAESHNCHLHTAFPLTPSAGLFKQGTYENEHLDFTKRTFRSGTHILPITL